MTLEVQDQLAVGIDGILQGNGTISGNVQNAGLIQLGESVGRLSIEGDASLLSSGNVDIEIAGPLTSEHDRLAITGSITLGGTCTLSYPGGFHPQEGQVFEILTFNDRLNEFTEVIGTDIGGGITLDIEYGPTYVRLHAIEKACPEDVDSNGSVNVTDLLELLSSWGACPPPCPADSTGDGAVNVTDLLDLLAAWGPCS